MAPRAKRPTVALYHHLPPGGALRSLEQLTRRSADRIRYVLFELDISEPDPYANPDHSYLHQFVDEVNVFPVKAGGDSRLGRWSRTVPAVLRAERRIARQINERSFDALVVHPQRFTQAPSLLQHVTIPTIYFVQEPRRRSFEYALKEPATAGFRRLTQFPAKSAEAWARRQDIRSTRAAKLLLSNSDHSREYIWRAYGRDAVVIRLGVDSDRFVLPASNDRDAELLSVGALDPTKGHELVIEAVGRLNAAYRPRLRLITNRATTGTATSLMRLADCWKVDLDIETDLSDAELITAYQRATAVVLAGRVEPLGLVPIEAMSCGTPSVAVREGGYRETIIDGVTGILTERTPQSLAEGIERVLSGKTQFDRETLRKQALLAHSWNAAAARYADSIEAAAAP